MPEACSLIIGDELHMPGPGGIGLVSRRHILPLRSRRRYAHGGGDIVRKEHRRDEGDQIAYS